MHCDKYLREKNETAADHDFEAYRVRHRTRECPRWAGRPAWAAASHSEPHSAITQGVLWHCIAVGCSGGQRLLRIAKWHECCNQQLSRHHAGLSESLCRCGAWISKIDGCDYVTCAQCHQQFCWTCGEETIQHK